MTEPMMSSGVQVVQVWVELLPGGQVEVRAGLSDGSFLLLNRTDGDLARMMKRLVDGFLDYGDDREMLSSNLLTGLLRVRAADQISDVRVKTVELNKLLQSIISLPHKFSQSEAVLDFFRPSAKDRVFRPAQDPKSNHQTSPIIDCENKDREQDQTIRYQDQEQDQIIRHLGQEQDQTISHQDQDQDQTIRLQGQEQDQTIRHQDQEQDQTIRHQEQDQTMRHQGQEQDQTIRHQGQEQDQTMRHQGQEQDQTMRHQGQEQDQTMRHQGQEQDQTMRHQGQEQNQTIRHQDQEKDQTIRHDAQEVERTTGQQDQEESQTIRNEVWEDEQIFRQKDHEENKTNRSQVQGVDHNIRDQVQEENQTFRHHQEVDHQDQDLVFGLQDPDVLRRASVLSEVWKSNGFCLANTETILFDMTPPTKPVSQSDGSTDRRDDGQTEEAELQTCPAPWLGPLHLLHSWTQETDILE